MRKLLCKFSVSTETLSDILVAELSQIGFDGFEVQDSSLLAYIPEGDLDLSAIESVLVKYASLGESSLISTEILESVNWNEEWEKHFDPVVVADRILIRAPFHKVKGSFDHEIIITPKMAFGTGHHETTFMVLQEMLNIDMAGMDVLDYGCGTGVLSVLADQKKARHIDAIDYDNQAVTNAQEIIGTNSAHNVSVALGNKIYFANRTYDLILANINKNVLKDSMRALQAASRTKAKLLMSGILRSDSVEMIEMTENFGFQLKSKQERGQWVLLVFIRA